ncbi:unnamed protein product [Symbiodinium sp. CCMP2456]|nr:unnamed protein product [Symbiodinium sp. CCMP2456]
MAENEQEVPGSVDDAWLTSWGGRLQHFIAGMEVPTKVSNVIKVDSQDAGVDPEVTREVDTQVALEHEEARLLEPEEEAKAEEVEFCRREEERVLQQQAAAYQAREDWEMQSAMRDSQNLQPLPRRKWLRARKMDLARVDDKDGCLRMQITASMVDDIPESDISTVILDPQGPTTGPHAGAAVPPAGGPILCPEAGGPHGRPPGSAPEQKVNKSRWGLLRWMQRKCARGMALMSSTPDSDVLPAVCDGNVQLVSLVRACFF